MHLGRLHGGVCFNDFFHRDCPFADPLAYLFLTPAASRSSISKDKDRSNRCDSVLERARSSLDMVQRRLRKKGSAVEGLWTGVLLPGEKDVTEAPWPGAGAFGLAVPYSRISTIFGAQLGDQAE